MKQSNANWLVTKILCSSNSSALRMSIAECLSGVQERLGRVEKFSAFYLVRIAKEFSTLQHESWDLGIFARIPFLIW